MKYEKTSVNIITSEVTQIIAQLNRLNIGIS